jgi:hypothetical protein
MDYVQLLRPVMEQLVHPKVCALTTRWAVKSGRARLDTRIYPVGSNYSRSPGVLTRARTIQLNLCLHKRYPRSI